MCVCVYVTLCRWVYSTKWRRKWGLLPWKTRSTRYFHCRTRTGNPRVATVRSKIMNNSNSKCRKRHHIQRRRHRRSARSVSSPDRQKRDELSVCLRLCACLCICVSPPLQNHLVKQKPKKKGKLTTDGRIDHILAFAHFPLLTHRLCR